MDMESCAFVTVDMLGPNALDGARFARKNDDGMVDFLVSDCKGVEYSERFARCPDWPRSRWGTDNFSTLVRS